MKTIWVLIFATVGVSGEVSVTKMGSYKTMDLCFQERDKLLAAAGHNIYFPKGVQAVCIPTEVKNNFR